MNNTDVQNRVRALVEPALQGLGYDLVAVEWLNDVRGPILRLSVDAPGGIGIHDCTRASQHVSQALDSADPIDSSYHLEVSSPGIERPLQRLSDFVRFSGYRARVRLREGPRRRFTGVLCGADGNRIRIQVDSQEFDFELDQVEKAHLVLELDEYQALAGSGT